MIGQTIETPSRFSWASVVSAMLGLGLVAISVVERNPHYAVLSIFPFALALALWREAARRFVALVHQDRLELLEPRGTIDFDELQSVTLVKSGTSEATLVIATRDRVQQIPATASVPLDEIELFLRPLIPSPAPSEPHPEMAEYVREQLVTFGEDRVAVFMSRNKTTERKRVFAKSSRVPAVCLALTITGVLWCFAPFVIDAKGADAWYFGGLLAFVSFVLWLTYRSNRETKQKVPRKMAGACIVVSPLGVAMIQGDVRGKLRWDEIHEVRHKGQAGFQISSAHRGLFLVVKGTMIHILDIYDTPLVEIEAKLRQNL